MKYNEWSLYGGIPAKLFKKRNLDKIDFLKKILNVQY
jgi:hypothetical protein